MFIFFSSLHRELKRDKMHFVKLCVIYDTMWLWSGIWWFVMWIKAVILCQLVVPLCSVDKPLWWHLWYAFLHPCLTRPSEVADIIPSVPGTTTNKWLSHTYTHYLSFQFSRTNINLIKDPDRTSQISTLLHCNVWLTISMAEHQMSKTLCIIPDNWIAHFATKFLYQGVHLTKGEPDLK